MALFKRRPRIRLLVPAVIYAGRPFDVAVVVRCEVAVPVSAVLVQLEGQSIWFERGQHGRHRRTHEFHGALAQVWAGGELSAGEHTFQVRFAIPAGSPASYGGNSIQIAYAVRVRAVVPRWLDRKETFPILVRATPAAPSDHPAVFVSNSEGPQGRKPYFELSAATTEIVPATTLSLAASLANTEHNRYRALELDLVAIETFRAWHGTRIHRRGIMRFEIPLDGVGDGQAVPFGLRAPANLTPGFDTARVSLAWVIEARVDVAFGFDPELQVPIKVRVPAPTESLAPPRVVPAVGAARIELVWREVASAHGFDLSDGALIRAYDDGSTARIWREQRGRRGQILCAEIAIPELGVGLELGRGGVHARDREHQRILRERLAEMVEAASVIEIGERALRCERRANATRRPVVSAFAGEVDRLAQALAATRATLPAPAAIAAEVDDWRRAAAAVDGQLELAGPSIRGLRAGAAWSLALGWDAGRPHELVLRVVPPEPLDGRHHVAWRDGDPTDSELAVLCEGATALSIARGELFLVLASHAWTVDRAAERLGVLVDRALELCRAPSAGVYR